MAIRCCWAPPARTERTPTYTPSSATIRCATSSRSHSSRPRPLLLVANNDVPVRTATDLIALAKAKPGTLSFGSYGNGSSNHLVAELFNTMAGIETNHIPYRGSAPMMTDLIGGRIQFAFDGIVDHHR